jgi:hypothetical protein
MRRRVMTGVTLVLLVCLALLAQSGRAQEEPSKPEQKAVTTSGQAQTRSFSVYRLEFVVRELEDGKRINSRSYSLCAGNHERAMVRVGSLVPTGPFESEGDAKRIQYQNSGISIDFTPGEWENGLSLYTSFESSNVVAPERRTEERGSTPSLAPVIRQVRFSGTSLVTPGKPTVIGAVDDVTTNRRYEIEVTATKVK